MGGSPGALHPSHTTRHAGPHLRRLALADQRFVRLDCCFIADFCRKTGSHFCEICLAVRGGEVRRDGAGRACPSRPGADPPPFSRIRGSACVPPGLLGRDVAESRVGANRSRRASSRVAHRRWWTRSTSRVWKSSPSRRYCSSGRRGSGRSRLQSTDAAGESASKCQQ